MKKLLLIVVALAVVGGAYLLIKPSAPSGASSAPCCPVMPTLEPSTAPDASIAALEARIQELGRQMADARQAYRAARAALIKTGGVAAGVPDALAARLAAARKDYEAAYESHPQVTARRAEIARLAAERVELGQKFADLGPRMKTERQAQLDDLDRQLRAAAEAADKERHALLPGDDSQPTAQRWEQLDAAGEARMNEINEKWVATFKDLRARRIAVAEAGFKTEDLAAWDKLNERNAYIVERTETLERELGELYTGLRHEDVALGALYATFQDAQWTARGAQAETPDLVALRAKETALYQDLIKARTELARLKGGATPPASAMPVENVTDKTGTASDTGARLIWRDGQVEVVADVKRDQQEVSHE